MTDERVDDLDCVDEAHLSFHCDKWMYRVMVDDLESTWKTVDVDDGNYAHVSQDGWLNWDWMASLDVDEEMETEEDAVSEDGLQQQ